MSKKIVTNVEEVAAALQNIGPGLTIELIHVVLRAGETARGDVDSYLDPVNAGGWEQFRFRVRSLRGELLPFGWTPEGYRGASLVVSPDKRRQIWIMVGDETTGQNGNPTTLRPKGPAFEALVEGNQLLLFPMESDEPVEDVEENAEADLRETWVLLVHRRVVDREGELFVVMQAEVSLAKSMNNRRPDDWHARFRIPDLELPLLEQKPMDFTEAEDVEVPVVRKDVADADVPAAEHEAETGTDDNDVDVNVQRSEPSMDDAASDAEE